MAYSILFVPYGNISAHGDIIFTVIEDVKAFDPATYPDYKYIADVYIGATKVVTLKAVPRPDTKIGVFNIGPVIRNYVSAVFNPDTAQILAQSMGSGEFFIEATVKFGEDYDFNTYSDVMVDDPRIYFNHYNGRLIGTLSNLPDSDGPLTVRPTATPVRCDSTFNLVPYLPTSTEDVSVTIRTYDADGNLIRTIDLNYTPSYAPDLLLFNFSKESINTAQADSIDDSVKFYTVQFRGDEILRFDCTCENTHEIFTVHFLNRYGGFESRDFTKVSRKTIDIDKQEFGRLPYSIDSGGAVTYFNTNKVYNETRSIYSSQYKEKLVLNTDILSDDEYKWLGDLIISPMAFIEMEGDGDVFFIPIIITGNNYEYKKYINDEMTNLTINVEFGDTFNAQFR